MYKINGENVSPQYVERVIGHCPGVEFVEVMGIPDEKYGETGAAFIDIGDFTEEKHLLLRQYCRQSLQSFEIPKYALYCRKSLWPVSQSGKISKSLLREAAVKALKNISSDELPAAAMSEITQDTRACKVPITSQDTGVSRNLCIRSLR